MKLQFALALAVALLGRAAVAQSITPAIQSKIDGKLKEVVTWAATPAVVAAVRAHNTALPAEQAALTQDKWRTLTVLDPLVRGFTKNAAGQFLKSKKDDVVVEAFLSGAGGCKVAFIAKTSAWCHKGKEKHDVPMAGKSWQGPIELDDSTGQQQLQISVPVLDGGKPIGSLVVGLSMSGLSR